jgi:hypothetical protein
MRGFPNMKSSRPAKILAGQFVWALEYIFSKKMAAEVENDEQVNETELFAVVKHWANSWFVQRGTCADGRN